MPSRPRRPLTAILLSLLGTGLGQIYCGRFGKGLVLLFGAIVLGCIGQWAILPVDLTFRIVAMFCLVADTALWVYAMIDAGRLATRTGASYVLRDYNRWYVYVLLALLGVPISLSSAAYVRSGIMEAFVIRNASMAPAIHAGERVLADKLAYRDRSVERGDVVVFRGPGARSYVSIRRVVALAGDTVEVRSGELYVNGARLERTRGSASGEADDQPLTGEVFQEVNGNARYDILIAPPVATLAAGSPEAGGDLAATTVPVGHCFVLGDNRDRAVDSRHFGPVPLADIIGRVLCI